MNKLKRILALGGVLLLVAMYLITLVSALFTTPFTISLFKASVFCTIAIPCLLYAFMLIYKVLKQHNEGTGEHRPERASHASGRSDAADRNGREEEEDFSEKDGKTGKP